MKPQTKALLFVGVWLVLMALTGWAALGMAGNPIYTQ